MKKTLLFVLFAMTSLCGIAQTDNTTVAEPQPAAVAQQQLLFGYVSYSEVLKAMPEYSIAARNDSTLRASYDAEAKRVETEFNDKYEDFLEGMRDFPETILLKRQTELQQMLERNIQFKEESRKLLADAKKEIYQPVHDRLNSILKQIALKNGYAFILNTDSKATPFINPAMGVDVTAEVLKAATK